MTAAVTPLEALRRLYEVARKVDASESGEFDNALQGELAVAESVLRVAAAAPVATDRGSDPTQFQAGVIEGYERSAKALSERAVGWRQHGDHDLAEEVLQCRSMLHDQKPAIVQPSYQDLLDTLQQVTNEREEARGNARHLREEVKKAMTLVEAVEYLRAVEQRRQERRERLGLDHPIKLFQIWMSDMGQSCEWIGDDQFSGFVNQGKYEAFHAGFEIGQQTAGAAAPVVPVAAQPVVPAAWRYEWASYITTDGPQDFRLKLEAEPRKR